jgi:uncharacterized protein
VVTESFESIAEEDLATRAFGANAAALIAGNSAYKSGNYSTAISIWNPLAEAGDPNAQVFMSIIYDTGKGVIEDHVRSARWLERAALQGSTLGRFAPQSMVELV